MAMFHLSIKIVTRGKGKSVVSAAAYRSGEKIANEYDGEVHDYSRKRGVVDKIILLPEHAPKEFQNRSVLWNSVEKVEKAKNAQLARDVEISLPIELSFDEQKKLVVQYCNNNFVKQGMCADICFHDMKKGNPHAHILLTLRPINKDGTWGQKQKKEYILDKNGEKIYDKKKRQYKCKTIPTTDWNEHDKAEEWRSNWADLTNQYLKNNYVEERIDYRSYERQGIEQIPTIHLGPVASQMEKRGYRSERGDINRQIKADNKLLREMKAKIKELVLAAKAAIKDKIHNLVVMLEGIRSHFIITQYQDIRNDEEFSRLSYSSSINEKAILQCMEIDKLIDGEADVNKKYDLQEQRIGIYYKAGYSRKEDVKRDYRILNDRNIAKGRLEEQSVKLEVIMDKDLTEYNKNLDSLDIEELDDFAAERYNIRPVVEAETRRSLMELYGEKYKELTFQNAVEVVDEKLSGRKVTKDIKAHNAGKDDVANVIIQNNTSRNR